MSKCMPRVVIQPSLGKVDQTRVKWQTVKRVKEKCKRRQCEWWSWVGHSTVHSCQIICFFSLDVWHLVLEENAQGLWGKTWDFEPRITFFP